MKNQFLKLLSVENGDDCVGDLKRVVGIKDLAVEEVVLFLAAIGLLHLNFTGNHRNHKINTLILGNRDNRFARLQLEGVQFPLAGLLVLLLELLTEGIELLNLGRIVLEQLLTFRFGGLTLGISDGRVLSLLAQFLDTCFNFSQAKFCLQVFDLFLGSLLRTFDTLHGGLEGHIIVHEALHVNGPDNRGLLSQETANGKSGKEKDRDNFFHDMVV